MGKRFQPGTATWITSDSPSSQFSGVFEDDGTTGYFYAYDRRLGAGILDAVHIYDAASVAHRDSESDAEVRWSADGLKAGLFINAYLHAVIDFEARVAYGRTNFPRPQGAWAADARAPWSDELGDLLV